MSTSTEKFRKTNYAALKYISVRKKNRMVSFLASLPSRQVLLRLNFKALLRIWTFDLNGLEYLGKPRCRGLASFSSCPGSGEPVDVVSMFGDANEECGFRRRVQR